MDKKDGVDPCLCAEHKRDGSVAEALDQPQTGVWWQHGL